MTIEVFRTSLRFGTVEVDAYSNLIPELTGNHRNFLSGLGMASSIGLANNTTMQNRMSKDLKSLLGQGFTTIQGRYKNASGAFSKVTLWDTKSASAYYGYHAGKGNPKALAIAIALIDTTLNRLIDDQFARPFYRGEAQQHVDRVLNEPRPWERLYSEKMLARVRRWWFPRDFFWNYIYNFLTPEERAHLDAVNPVKGSSRQRDVRIHQHLSPEVVTRLEPSIEVVTTLLGTATSKQDFETRYHRHFGFDQGELAL